MNRAYRALLRLYPRSFRDTYGEEMAALFRDRLAIEAGAAGRVALLLGALIDVVPNALAVHAEILGQDLRYTLRTLSRAPGFALTAVVVVAFGVGANTAAFSVADFVLLRPLPFPDSHRLVRIWERPPGYAQMELSPANYRDWKEMTSSFEGMAFFNNAAVNLLGTGAPTRVESAQVGRELFDVLGVEPLRGRAFAPGGGDEDDLQTVVLSYGLWQSEFGGDPDVLGRSVNLDGAPYRVIGVMPETFLFPRRTTRLWVPMRLDEHLYLDRTNNFLEVVARLGPGVSVEEARADLDRAAARLAATYPDTNAETRSNLYPMRDDLSRSAKLLLGALGGAALCILILACANLTNLLLARGAARGREVAVRAALGAGRERLVRQLVTESAVLALVGGGVGVALGAAAVPLLAQLVPTTLPIAARPELDLRVLALALLFTAVTGIGFGMVPALRASGGRGLESLRDGARGGGGRTRRLRSILVGVQVASSLVLLVCSGLLTRAMWRLQETDPGFRVDGVLTLRTALPRPAYDETATRHVFYRRVIEEIEALPGVTRAAYTSGVPMVMRGGVWPVATGEGEQLVRQAANTASLRFVTSGFLDALEIPLVRGRRLDEGDGFDQTFVAVVSESFVERFWPDQDPLGKRFEFALAERIVVGVARDIRVRGLEQASEPQVYLPDQQVWDGALLYYAPKDLVVRSDLEPEALISAIRRIVASVDPQQPVSHVRTMAEVVAEGSSARKAQLRVLAALAVTALLLSGIGIHGLLAYTVSLRSREIGVRLALGARRVGIVGMVVREAVLLTVLGIVPGVLVALWAGQALSALLVGVRPGDPVVFGLSVAVTLGMALAGSVAPALRAVRVDPVSALRT